VREGGHQSSWWEINVTGESDVSERGYSSTPGKVKSRWLTRYTRSVEASSGTIARDGTVRKWTLITTAKDEKNEKKRKTGLCKAFYTGTYSSRWKNKGLRKDNLMFLQKKSQSKRG